MSGAQRVLDVPQGQAGQGCSRANRGRKVTLTLQRHSGSRWNKNEQNLRGRSEDGKAGVPGRGFSFLSIFNVNGLAAAGWFPSCSLHPGLWAALDRGLAQPPQSSADLTPVSVGRNPRDCLGPS